MTTAPLRTLRLTALALALWVTACSAQSDGPRITIDPVMARGPASAPVTLIEFSDYQ
ncbi:MAG TPA: hypothetical protein VML54_16445 [Candidatus Limnocylindrales bacterium]|nr:hypothetical protein [Candidatus Limnocylindrales bacterium]